MAVFKSVRFLLMGLALFGCTRVSGPSRLRIEIRPPIAHCTGSVCAPAAANGFTCYGVNVTGPGIPPRPADFGCAPPSAAVPPPGILAGLVPVTGGTIEVDVPPGPSRMVQVFGVESSVGCPTVASILADLASYGSSIQTPYEVGRTTVDVSEEATVRVASNYDSGNLKQMFCSSTTGLNLEVPIELLDRSLTSITASPLVFERTRTSLDPALYDGNPVYSFEVVASNLEASSQNIVLQAADSSIAATITVPPSVTLPTRFRTLFTVPPSSATNYRVGLPMTGTSDYVAVTAARILVRQVGATKTRLYFPLIGASSTQTTGVGGELFPVDSTTSTTPAHGDPDRYAKWLKDSAAWNGVGAGTPWTLEAIIHSSSVAGTAFALLMDGSGNAVAGAEVSTSSMTPSLQTVDFSDSAANFVDGMEFYLKIKTSSGTYLANVAKAGLWLTLDGMTRAQLHYRVGRELSPSAGTTEYTNYQRAYLDRSAFSNPVLLAETTGKQSVAAGDVYFIDAGAAFAGTAGGLLLDLVPSPLAAVSYASGVKQRFRIGPATLGSAQDYFTRVDVPAAAVNAHNDSRLIVNVSN